MQIPSFVSLILAVSLSLGCSPSGPAPLQKPTAHDLAAAFAVGLNGGRPAIQAFVGQWCSDQVPASQRVDRLLGLAEQGSPFKFVKILKEAPREFTAVYLDREGLEVGARFEVSSAMKLERVLVAPLEALNAPPPKDYREFKNLATLAESIRSDEKTPGIGIAVLHEGKLEAVAAGEREMSGKAKVDPDEPWSIGSIGKPICSTVIGRLIELGKLRWETTLGEALKDVPMKDGYRDVTIEQLMQHRGGIPEDLGMDQARVDGIVAGAVDPSKIRENYIKDILSRDPIGAPGERNAYSNAGYALLGMIAERTAGKPYESLVHELVFRPLGLRQSFTGRDEKPKERPRGHIAGPEGLEPMDFGGPMEIMFAPAGGGLWMSTPDLVRFGQAHLDGLNGKDGLLKAQTVRRLHRGIPETPGGEFQYGCGWGIERTDDGLVFHGHNGSNGTMRAQLAIFKDQNLVVACVVNSGGEREPSPPLLAALAVARKSRAAG